MNELVTDYSVSINQSINQSITHVVSVDSWRSSMLADDTCIRTTWRERYIFCISQGSVATCLRSDGKCYMIFLRNLIPFPVVKELLKSVKIWQSSRLSSAANLKDVVLLGRCVYGRYSWRQDWEVWAVLKPRQRSSAAVSLSSQRYALSQWFTNFLGQVGHKQKSEKLWATQVWRLKSSHSFIHIKST